VIHGPDHVFRFSVARPAARHPCSMLSGIRGTCGCIASSRIVMLGVGSGLDYALFAERGAGFQPAYQPCGCAPISAQFKAGRLVSSRVLVEHLPIWWSKCARTSNSPCRSSRHSERLSFQAKAPVNDHAETATNVTQHGIVAGARQSPGPARCEIMTPDHSARRALPDTGHQFTFHVMPANAFVGRDEGCTRSAPSRKLFGRYQHFGSIDRLNPRSAPPSEQSLTAGFRSHWYRWCTLECAKLVKVPSIGPHIGRMRGPNRQSRCATVNFHRAGGVPRSLNRTGVSS